MSTYCMKDTVNITITVEEKGRKVRVKDRNDEKKTRLHKKLHWHLYLQRNAEVGGMSRVFAK
jgi:hypothetical protein